MEIWSVIVMILLLVGTALFLGFGIYYANKNLQRSQMRRLIPFSATMGPDANPNVPLTGKNADGQTVNQISCPAGYHVNIVGAFFQVFDPYGECTNPQDNLVSSAITATCGATGSPAGPGPVEAGFCQSDGDCFDPNIFTCNSKGKCELRKFCKTDSDCESGSSASGVYKCVSGYCVDKNVCLGITYDGSDKLTNASKLTGLTNPICQPSNTQSKCAIRDASAYLASKCDGHQGCVVEVEDFGPYPCSGFEPVPVAVDTSSTAIQDFTAARTSPYSQLPFSYGFPGGVPSNSKGGQSSPGSISLGYYTHGVFQCVPDDE